MLGQDLHHALRGALVKLYKEDKDREEKKNREVSMLQWSKVHSR